MKNSKYIADYVYLSEASYADFANPKYSPKESIINVGSKKPKPESFAKLVTDHYTVEAHWEDKAGSDESGFSDTLFRGTAESGQEGKYILALKGTSGAKDLVIVDGFDIVHDGLAHHQIVDMYNFWQQIKAEKGQPYRVATVVSISKVISDKLIEEFKNASDTEKDKLESEWIGKGYFVDTGKIKKIVFINSDEYYQDERATGLGIDPGQVITTGHSLGGGTYRLLSLAYSPVTLNTLIWLMVPALVHLLILLAIPVHHQGLIFFKFFPH